MMAPETPSVLPLKSASVMEVSMVTGGPSLPCTMPEKVNFASALMAKRISGVGQGIFSDLPALGEEGSEHDGTC